MSDDLNMWDQPLQEPPIIDLADDEDTTVATDPRTMARYECRSCGYTYEPVKGTPQADIPPGIAFEHLPADWNCPVCSAGKNRFEDIGPVGTPSGFKENLGYGVGVNLLTPGQKNVLIFSGLGLGFFFFMSLYFLN